MFLKTIDLSGGMQIEKHLEALKEVELTIADALNDPEGLQTHQRRLMSMLSMGVQHIVEVYLHRCGGLKPGAFIKHEWFLLSDRHMRDRLEAILTRDWASLPRIEEVCYLANKVEQGRNDIVYGAPLHGDLELRKKVEQYLELKNIVQEETGELV